MSERLLGATALGGSPPHGYPPLTVLTKEQCAQALGVSLDTLDRAGIPVSYALGSKTPRIIWRQVIEWLEKAS